MAKRKTKDEDLDGVPATIGRPRLFPDPVEFAAMVESYFASEGKPSMSGLALALGFSDRESFSKYEDYEEPFSRTVKRARLRIEEDRHKRLLDKNQFTPGVIFDLKNNHGWKDNHDHNVTGTVSVQFSTVYEQPPKR